MNNDFLDSIGSHSHFDPTNPQVEAENRSERLIKGFRRTEADELAREKLKEDLKVDRLPYWLHPEADYLPEDSGMTVGDNETHD